MKLLLFFITICCCSFASAQTLENPGTPEERAEKMTSEMHKQLPLTEAQLPAIKALNLKYAKIIQSEVLDKDLNSWSKYNKSMKINKKKEEELKPLLSEAQWKNYKKLKSEAISKAWSRIF